MRTVRAPSDDTVDRKAPPELLLNPELSRLAFNERILAFAEDPAVPLLERLRFLGMAGERLDDFFMSRVAHLKLLLSANENERSIDGLTAAEQLDAIAVRVTAMMRRAYDLLETQLLPGLEARGITIERWTSMTAEDRAFVLRNYVQRIEALVTPLVADPSRPFPHIRNLRPALTAMVRLHDSSAEQFLAIELPGDLPRFVPLAGRGRFVPLEDVIDAALPELYPGLERGRSFLFRVTRSAHMDLDDEPRDLLQAIEEAVRRRPYQEVVRLECERAMPPAMRHRLLGELQHETIEQPIMLGEQDVYTVGRLVDLAALEEIASMDLPNLKFQPLPHRTPLRTDRGVLAEVRERDILLRFPQDDFEESVERFLLEAAADPAVVSIKITVYRTSKDSAVVAALRTARAMGKDVTAVVELKASFEEQDNIAWARDLEQDGIRVVLSPVRFKVHAKIGLVVRREDETLRHFAYIGTGNLNAATARSYVDFGLLTADPEITRELGEVFKLLAGEEGHREFNRLVVAPFDMRERFLTLIDREIEHARAGRMAGIRLQLNGLSDRQLVGALYRASQAGVRIDMMVREICALRPGMRGISENIGVVSLVGRLLQHARIIHFRNGGDDEYFIGSADWRPRNLHERIEVVTSIRQPDHKKLLDTVLTETLNDPTAWRLQSDGEYVPAEEALAT
jgi:polyphosphate kinase